MIEVASLGRGEMVNNSVRTQIITGNLSGGGGFSH